MRPALLIALALLSTVPATLGGWPVAGGLTPHAPIRIVGNSGFTVENGVVGGTGTVNDPYVIEGWDINASAQIGIVLRFTTAYFIIRNVHVYDGNLTGRPDINGINLETVKYGRIEDSLIVNNDFGIALVSSSNITITGVTSTENREYGIYVSGGGNNTITGNVLTDNEDGISVSASWNNLIEGNLVDGTASRRRYGVWLSAGSTSTTVRWNTVVGGSISFLVNGLANGNLLEGNNSTNAFWFGTNLVGTRDNILASNHMKGSHVGIVLTNTNRTLINDNIAVENDYGIGLEVNNWNNTVTGNISGNNDFAMYTSGSGGFNLIYDNIFSGKFGDAFDQSTQNSWNIPLIPGFNILSGEFIGGNYYANYGGTDADGNGIGDNPQTIQPAQVTDNFPLVVSVELFRFDWADFDNDGRVMITDLSDIAIRFEQNSVYWDFDISGLVDIADVSQAAILFDAEDSVFPGLGQAGYKMEPVWRFLCKSLPEPEKSYCLKLPAP